MFFFALRIPTFPLVDSRLQVLSPKDNAKVAAKSDAAVDTALEFRAHNSALLEDRVFPLLVTSAFKTRTSLGGVKFVVWVSCW